MSSAPRPDEHTTMLAPVRTSLDHDAAGLRTMVEVVASLEAMVGALRRDIATNQRTIDLLAEAQRAIRNAA